MDREVVAHSGAMARLVECVPNFSEGRNQKVKPSCSFVFHIFSIYLQVMATFFLSKIVARLVGHVLDPSSKKKDSRSLKWIFFILSSMLFFSRFRSSMPLPQRSGTPQGAACWTWTLEPPPTERFTPLSGPRRTWWRGH